MSKRQSQYKPPSLTQLFEPPEDFLGSFGWICGYTADAGFLNDAVERFTVETLAQRAHSGKLAIALMLDPGNPQISPVDVPGVAHLPMRNVAQRPFRLLHSKVAMLAFRNIENANDWKLRLIVSTGNWTRSTLEESLDLAWHIELDRQALKVRNDDIRQARADIAAAWDLMKWLRDLFDTRLLTCKPAGRQDTPTSDSHARFEILMSEIRMPRNGKPRFLDSRSGALLNQLPTRIESQAQAVRRNYIGMGSGFYEQDANDGQVPRVIRQIVDKMREKQLLTQNAEVDVFVNPRGCQAVAGALPAFNMRKWTLRAAHAPNYFGTGTFRSLHAKFVFSAHYRKDSNVCNSAWIYLGSGNLTAPGFTGKMSRNGGNLEAGVVFAPDGLYWVPRRGTPLEHVITNLLPINWDVDNIIETPDQLKAGKEFTANEPTYFAAPVSCLLWETVGDVNYLKPLDGDVNAIDVLDPATQICSRHDTHGFIWTASRPRQVLVRWHGEDGHELRALIPVLDKLGRIAAARLPALDIDEVWWQLENFPLPPDADDVLPEEDGEDIMAGDHSVDTKARRPAAYPIRKMMQLVENIAAKQTSVALADWNLWCNRLEQSMIQAADSSVVKTCKKFVFNPLSPLWEVPFRPGFAESRDSQEGVRYEDALRRIEAAWKRADLKPLGDRS